MEVVASLSQGRTAAAQCGLFTNKSVSVIFEPPCTSDLKIIRILLSMKKYRPRDKCSKPDILFRHAFFILLLSLVMFCCVVLQCM